MRDFDRNISVKEMQIQDKNSSDYGIHPSTLMECAGYSAANTIVSKLTKREHIFIMCGTGNNGGDGFVIARHLASQQNFVSVFLVGHPDDIRTNEAKQNWDILQKLLLNLHIYVVRDSSFFEDLPEEVTNSEKKCKFIIDCLLGTGIRGKIREPMRSAIEYINRFHNQSTKIISIDVPTGVDPDNGKAADVYVKPDILITFHQKKNGFENIGVPEIIVNSIGIPLEANLFVGSGDIQFLIPKRNIFNHKGQYGKILIIGGSEQFSGAPALAGMAALEMGIDLVYIFAPKSVADVIRGYSPNLIVHSGKKKNLCKEDFKEISDLLKKVDSVVIGPGMGTDSLVQDLFLEIITLIKDLKIPIVIDADAIRLVKPLKEEIGNLLCVITPHAREFFDLTGITLPDQTQFQNRISFFKKLENDWKTVFLVKGKFDYISNGKTTRINKTGVPEMAVGGTGDILAGIVGSLLAIKMNLFDAACCAAYINGKLGEIYQNYNKGTKENGKPMKSSDLLEFIPTVLKEY